MDVTLFEPYFIDIFSDMGYVYVCIICIHICIYNISGYNGLKPLFIDYRMWVVNLSGLHNGENITRGISKQHNGME